MQKELREQQLLNLFHELENKYDFQGFVHSTSFENFINIMKSNRIYCRNHIKNCNIKSSEIALDEVINKTRDRYKNYVRFYWRNHTPTYYRCEGIKPKKALVGNYKAHSPNPVIFLFNYKIAFNEKTYFTNKNAATFEHECCNIPNNSFNFDYIFHNEPFRNDEDKTEIIHARCAEFLHPDQISLDDCSDIFFRNKADYDRATLMFGQDERFYVSKGEFYNHWLRVSNYSYTINTYEYKLSTLKRNKINLQIEYNFGEEFIKNKYNLSDFSHEVVFFDECGQETESYIIEPNSEAKEIRFGCSIRQNYSIMCYYIDNYECIRIKIDD